MWFAPGGQIQCITWKQVGVGNVSLYVDTQMHLVGRPREVTQGASGGYCGRTTWRKIYRGKGEGSYNVHRGVGWKQSPHRFMCTGKLMSANRSVMSHLDPPAVGFRWKSTTLPFSFAPFLYIFSFSSTAVDWQLVKKYGATTTHFYVFIRLCYSIDLWNEYHWLPMYDDERFYQIQLWIMENTFA